MTVLKNDPNSSPDQRARNVMPSSAPSLPDSLYTASSTPLRSRFRHSFGRVDGSQHRCVLLDAFKIGSAVVAQRFKSHT
jgi:hypothetical protein